MLVKCLAVNADLLLTGTLRKYVSPLGSSGYHARFSSLRAFSANFSLNSVV